VKNRIKIFRAQFNLTQNALAKKVGVRRETIVFLEQGKYNPSLELAFRIARIFGEPVEEVFLFRGTRRAK
jgi:putative transcriptional regulator